MPCALPYAVPTRCRWCLLLILCASRCAAEVDITPAWLATNGPAPYVLDQAGTTYVLQTDVTASGTAFVVLAGGVSFNLNGHTVTYGNAPPPTVTNGGFEQGTGRSVPGWDLTGAPAASLVPNSTFLFGNQVLRFSTFSSAQTIVSDPVAITQVGHTYVASITPSGQLVDYGASLTLSVIDTVTHAVLGTGSSAAIQRGFSAVAPFTPTTTDAVALQIVATPAERDLDHHGHRCRGAEPACPTTTASWPPVTGTVTCPATALATATCPPRSRRSMQRTGTT